jgi:hypothetical protein
VGEEYADWQESPTPWVEMESEDLARKAIRVVESIYSVLEDRPELLEGRVA